MTQYACTSIHPARTARASRERKKPTSRWFSNTVRRAMPRFMT